MTGKQLAKLNTLCKKISTERTAATTHTTAGLFVREGYVTAELYAALHAAAGFDAAQLADDLAAARIEVA